MSSVVVDRRAIGTLPESVRKSRHRRLSIFGVALLGAAALAWYGQEWWTVGRFIESTDDAYVGGEITVIAPKVAGLIAEVAIADNQEVRAGDLLVKLDDRDYRAALAKAMAAVAGQQALLANLEATRRLQLSIIAQARAGIAAAEAETIRARDEQARYQKLSVSSFASIQAFQNADAVYKQAIAGDQRARAVLDAAQSQIDVIDTQKRQAEAALAAALADRDAAHLNLAYTELRAPVDGTVGNRSARTGAFATVGAQLVSIVPARGLWVDANFKENQLAAMRSGLSASITADILPGESFHGHVASLAPATGAQFSVIPAENATGNFTKIVQRVPVRIVLDPEASKLGRLRPGLSVTVSVDQHARAGAAP